MPDHQLRFSSLDKADEDAPTTARSDKPEDSSRARQPLDSHRRALVEFNVFNWRCQWHFHTPHGRGYLCPIVPFPLHDELITAVDRHLCRTTTPPATIGLMGEPSHVHLGTRAMIRPTVGSSWPSSCRNRQARGTPVPSAHGPSLLVPDSKADTIGKTVEEISTHGHHKSSQNRTVDDLPAAVRRAAECDRSAPHGPIRPRRWRHHRGQP
jgi:hypothetical protein